jgi:hypothetical protein
MSEQNSSDEIVNRLTQRATGYKPKLPPKLAQLLPFKMQIKELRARRAAYDDIRLILAEEKIIVSLNAIYRFCRDVIGEKTVRLHKPRPPKDSPSKAIPVLPPPEKIEATLREQRQRFPGPWSRRKPGPRIADSKNL